MKSVCLTCGKAFSYDIQSTDDIISCIKCKIKKLPSRHHNSLVNIGCAVATEQRRKKSLDEKESSCESGLKKTLRRPMT